MLSGVNMCFRNLRQKLPAGAQAFVKSIPLCRTMVAVAKQQPAVCRQCTAGVLSAAEGKHSPAVYCQKVHGRDSTSDSWRAQR